MKRLTILVLLLACLAAAQPAVEIETTEQGYGPSLGEGQQATISYKLTLKDGTEVESRSERQPYKFIVGAPNIIPGLSQGVQGMKMMESRTIQVPPELGYGAKDMGVIPPNSTLTFQLTLLNIESIKEVTLSDKFRDDAEFMEKRNAQNLDKPAMFEYVIRDFYTKPWRYDDGYQKNLRQCARVFGVFLLLLGLYAAGLRKGYWTL